MIVRVCLVLALLVVVATTPVRAEQPVGQTCVFHQCAIDEEGNLHIVYITRDWGEVYYMKYNGAAWIGPTLLPGSSPAWPPYTNPSIEVASDGRAHVIYGVKTGDYPDDLNLIYYAVANNSDGTGFSVVSTIGNDGYRRDGPEIVLDDFDRPHVSYHKTNKTHPYWWEIIYRRPDGDERIVAHYDVEDYAGHDPCIAIAGGQLHMAWYKGTGGKNDIIYATGTENTPDYGWSSWQVTSVQYGQYGNPPNIGVSPGGQVQIAYYLSDWSNPESPYHVGVFLNDPYGGEVQIDGYSPIPAETVGDQVPELAWDNNGNRYLGWCYHGRGETYYQINNDRYTLEPAGWLDVCAGNGAWYVRNTAVGIDPGGLYYQQIGGSAPPNQSPVALFDFSPATGDIATLFQFDGSDSYDPDNNLPLTYSWDWQSDGIFELIDQTSATATHTFPEPGTHTVTLQVKDALGATGSTSESIVIINYPPEADFAWMQVDLSDTVFFDATLSSDFEDATEDLRFHWDFDNDGVWDDDPFQTDSDSIIHVFPGPDSYPVKLRAVDQQGAFDDTVIVVELQYVPQPPEWFMAEDYPEDQGGAIALSWQLSPDDSSRSRGEVVEYRIRRQESGQSDYLEFSVAAGESTCVDTVTNGVSYVYSIAAFDGTLYSDWIDAPEDATAMDNLPPEPATGLAASIESLEEGWAVTLSWTASPSYDVITQSVYRSFEGGDWQGLVTLQPIDESFVDSITQAGNYCYRIGSSDMDNITFSDSVAIEAMGAGEATGLPRSLTLAAVSPNPIDGRLTLQFGVTEPGVAEFALFDLTGRQVVTTRSSCPEAGWFSLQWNIRDAVGRSVPGGTYVLKLVMNGESVSAPLVVLR